MSDSKASGAVSAEARSVPELGAALSNTGRWGEDDEKGTLNFITAEHTLRAARLVKTGRTVAASHPFVMEATPAKPRPGWHRMLYRENGTSACDAIMIEPHGSEITHIDALGHVSMDGTVYNERPFSQVITRDGLAFGSVLPLAEGIATRGVLLDIPASRGVDFLERGAEVNVADLERAEEWAGVRVDAGDAVIVRTGLEARERVTGPMPHDVRSGLGRDCIAWLHERSAATFGGDCFERLPSGDEKYTHPLHSVGLARMGLVLIDNIAVEDLSAACAEELRWEFFFVVAPLRIPKATGSPVNPLCIF
ncbi:cyclase family protein [Microbacterium sp. BWT-B31]|uniref:cyclase family protein n=1 Tax=Microbacterium sp. BWT-B31 TaxID=3232072 RepID=UPI0035270F71